MIRVVEEMKTCQDPLQKPDLENLSAERKDRYNAVRSAIRHAWDGYSAACLGSHYHLSLRYMLGILPADDLATISNHGISWLHGAATLYDSLDTLYLAGLTEEFEFASELVKKLPQPLVPTKTFEYSIRVLGGLLGGFAVSGDTDLLSAAIHTADAMLEGAFKSSPTPLPRMYDIVAPTSASKISLWDTGGAIIHRLWAQAWRTSRDALNEHHRNSLAGVGSFMLEFTYLSQLTGDLKYQDAADAILHHVIDRRTSFSNLVPMLWNVMSGDAIYPSHTTLGSGSDSFYEYLLKTPILLGLEGENESSFISAKLYLDIIEESLLSNTQEHVIDSSHASMSYPVDEADRYRHLLCFVPGMLALGTKYGPDFINKYPQNDQVLDLAQKLVNGCYESYVNSKSGLGPEEVRILTSGKGQSIVNPGYYLRPEFVESLFILYRTTGDSRYQEIAWEVFQNLEEHCKLESGYAGLADTNVPNVLVDEMPSFFIGETLKYLLLTFAPDDYVGLDEFVFTTVCILFEYVMKNPNNISLKNIFRALAACSTDKSFLHQT